MTQLATEKRMGNKPNMAKAGPKRTNAFVKAKAGEKRILRMLETLAQEITTWFDSTPSKLHKSFDERLRKKIAAIID